MPRLSPLCIAWACAALAMPPHALAAPQTIWRCASNSYSDMPCEGGREFGSGAPPLPSSEQRQQADEATRKDQAAAQRMQRERLRLEAQQPGANVIGGASPRDVKAPPRPTVLASSAGKRTKKPRGTSTDDFVATYATPDAGKPPRGKKPKPSAGQD